MDEKSCKDACYGDPRCGVWQFNINSNEPSRGHPDPRALGALKPGASERGCHERLKTWITTYLVGHAAALWRKKPIVRRRSSCATATSKTLR